MPGADRALGALWVVGADWSPRHSPGGPPGGAMWNTSLFSQGRKADGSSHVQTG